MDILLVAYIGTTVWVGLDASNLNVKAGKLGGGSLDMGVVGWVLACLLLWILAFPAYLVKRPEYVKLSTSKGSGVPRRKTKQKSPMVFLYSFIAGLLLMVVAGMIKTDLEVGFAFYLFVAALLGICGYLLIEVPIKK